MPTPMGFALAFVLVLGLLAAGIFLVRNPQKIYRMVSFGQPENRFGEKFFRLVGWFYIGGAILGVLMLAVAATLNWFHSH
jgi:hypothetical protein